VDRVAAVASPLIAIVGPTAAGKSAVALALARERSGEIVCCDSLQVYRGLDVGSAKATAEERAAVPHHLLDVVEPDQVFSAAEYSRNARTALAGIAERGRLAVVVGGTGLYLRALLYGLFEGPSRDNDLRERLERIATRRGDPGLHRMLAAVDPEAAARIAPRDRVRVIRALEVFRSTRRPISEHHRAGAQALRGHDVLVLGLDPPRDALRAAVERRTEEMFARGLLAEVGGLLDRGHGPELKPLRAIGYRQAVAVLRREMADDEARRAIVAETMRYAKRQMTWFRHQTRATWFAAPEPALAAARAWLDARR
jgi:tRNA dimethylallyltransferase